MDMGGQTPVMMAAVSAEELLKMGAKEYVASLPEEVRACACLVCMPCVCRALSGLGVGD